MGLTSDEEDEESTPIIRWEGRAQGELVYLINFANISKNSFRWL